MPKRTLSEIMMERAIKLLYDQTSVIMLKQRQPSLPLGNPLLFLKWFFLPIRDLLGYFYAGVSFAKMMKKSLFCWIKLLPFYFVKCRFINVWQCFKIKVSETFAKGVLYRSCAKYTPGNFWTTTLALPYQVTKRRIILDWQRACATG